MSVIQLIHNETVVWFTQMWPPPCACWPQTFWGTSLVFIFSLFIAIVFFVRTISFLFLAQIRQVQFLVSETTGNDSYPGSRRMSVEEAVLQVRFVFVQLQMSADLKCILSECILGAFTPVFIADPMWSHHLSRVLMPGLSRAFTPCVCTQLMIMSMCYYIDIYIYSALHCHYVCCCRLCFCCLLFILGTINLS